MEWQRAFLASQSSSAGSLNSDAVEDFRKRLKYFFTGPCEKWRISWKLLLQILKIGLVTTQLISFGLSNQMMVTFEDEILVTLRHLLLKGYNDRNIENYAVYTKSEVYEHVHFIVDQYVNLRNLSAGNHAYEKDGGKYSPLSICQDFYRKSLIFPENETFHIDPHVESECSDIYPSQLLADPTIMKKQLNITLDFKRLIRIKIHFALKAINVQTLFHQELPDCYVFAVATTFHNIALSGRIKMTLNSNTDIKECKDGNVTFTFPRNIHYLTFDSFIIVTCLTSLLLCAGSLIKGIRLQFEYTAFFRALRKNVPPWSDRMEFVNGWYILIVLSDSLAISGSLLKIGIHLKNFTSYDVCSILLGTATLLVWTEVIWYLDLFQKYNVLTLALKAAFPNVLRFCGCVITIYLGYCFCGWIVLGPYHSKVTLLPHSLQSCTGLLTHVVQLTNNIGLFGLFFLGPKFQTLNTVSECLFSVISGDVFHTFKNIRRSSYLVWLYSRLYLYSFVLLFVYMVFSLFISLITDTCNTVKQQQQDRRTESALRAFIDCRDLPDSGKFTLDEEPDSCSFCDCFRCVT